MKKYQAICGMMFVSTLLSACVGVPTGDIGVVTPVPVPIVIIDKQSTDKKTDKPTPQAVHVCTISAFTSTYQAENVNRGQAKLNAKKQCLKNHHAMFCQDQDIQCQTYE